MKKEAQVILLPTNKASNMFLEDDGMLYSSEEIAKVQLARDINQFYYILSDSDIQEGDWIFDLKHTESGHNKGQIFQKNFKYDSNDVWYYKIIATNDLTLIIKKNYVKCSVSKSEMWNDVNLPQLSQQGLTLLCKLYNEKKELKVMIEYDSHPTMGEIVGDEVMRGADVIFVKLDSQNCISISEVEEDVEKLAVNWYLKKHPQFTPNERSINGFIAGYKAAKQSKVEERMYSIVEVRNICNKMRMDLLKIDNFSNENFIDWIEENLK